MTKLPWERHDAETKSKKWAAGACLKQQGGEHHHYLGKEIWTNYHSSSLLSTFVQVSHSYILTPFPRGRSHASDRWFFCSSTHNIILDLNRMMWTNCSWTWDVALRPSLLPWAHNRHFSVLLPYCSMKAVEKMTEKRVMRYEDLIHSPYNVVIDLRLLSTINRRHGAHFPLEQEHDISTPKRM